jgi:hypothetical protein
MDFGAADPLMLTDGVGKAGRPGNVAAVTVGMSLTARETLSALRNVILL